MYIYVFKIRAIITNRKKNNVIKLNCKKTH